MENASKALLMAAEVLISIVIISALVLVFNSLTDYQKVADENEQEAEVVTFNNNYEAYNRDDVRGNELYSLINKVVDYNRRKSTVGTGDDEGQYLNYSPMTVYVDLTEDETVLEDLTFDGTFRIFEGEKKFTIDQTLNRFYDTRDGNYIFQEINEYEQIYTSKVMLNLATAIEKIYPTVDTNTLSIDEKIKIIYNFNNVLGKQYFTDANIVGSNLNNSLRKIIDGESSGTIKFPSKEEVYTYYEYLQFTRGHFRCNKVEHDQNTGRITRMEFVFTGEIS